MQRGARFSHFHCKFPPHSLRGICANFRQPVRKKGFMTRSEVQGAISRADKRYESDPQTINGALNFLLSKKVLLRKDDKLYFDQERSEYVLQCCKEGMEAGHHRAALSIANHCKCNTDCNAECHNR